MKVKFDENLGRRCLELFRASGHDCVGVPEQGMSSRPDREVFDACSAEGLVLVTLELAFSNPFSFPPQRTPGVAVLRLPKRPEFAHLDRLLKTLAQALREREINGRLWVVEPGRIREYQPVTDD